MTPYALQERHALADLLDEVGPDAPTLCGEWCTYDLAAHLVVRERRPDAGPGLVLPLFSGWTEKVRQGAKQDHKYSELVDRVRHRPWWITPVDELINLMEYFVHHEDVRRAEPDVKPRDLSEGFERALWEKLRPVAGPMLHGRSARLVAPGIGERTVGDSPAVTLTGRPSELVLFCYSRQAVADVTLEGPADQVEDLRTANLGV